ncbi:MAG: hypothetical protein NVS9B3_07900 [Gemmatimonadaceae bacterium]
MSVLTPRRRMRYEVLDDPRTSPGLRKRSLDDVACANAVFGGRRAVLVELDRVLATLASDTRHLSLLDVGPGTGDIPCAAREAARRRGLVLDVIGIDGALAAAAACRARGIHPACGDARRLPLGDASVDVVTCSQVLHHFSDDDAPSVLRELDRVARRVVIVSDIRRSWLAAAGIWLASFPLHFHPVSRHDAVVSVLRGFTAGELRAQLRSALGADADVRSRPGFRVTASWTPTRSRAP